VDVSAIPGLVTTRLSAGDAGRLGTFFELLQADPETVRFFHPHPLTPSCAGTLCTRQASCLDRYYITGYQGHIVAYSMLRGWDEGYETPSFGGCTHPELRGAGLGRWLLIHALAQCRAAGARKLRLTVYKENVRALHIYRKFGFAFSEKSEHELVGLVDLRSAVPAFPSGPNMAKVDAWLAKQARVA
jgi:ribosomal protein S18 acetylase RimI-like enzyme